MMNSEVITKLEDTFPSVKSNGEGYIFQRDIGEALKIMGFDVPGYQLRDLMERVGSSDGDDKVTVAQLNEIYSSLMEEKSAHVSQWQKGIVRVNDASYQVQGMAEHGADEIIHTIRIEEEVAFSDWINDKLGSDSDLKHLLPVDQDNGDLYKKVQDGLILCKLINIAQPETIDERAINKKNLNRYSKLENLVLALKSCSSIGCNVVNVDADDMHKGKPHLVLGIIWQIIRQGLFRQINLESVPGMIRLLDEGGNDKTADDNDNFDVKDDHNETAREKSIDLTLNEKKSVELSRLTPEQILVRWVNYHLVNASVELQMNNFTSDITDSTIYTHLIYRVAPPEAGVSLAPLKEEGKLNRACAMLNEAAKIDCRSFVTPQDVVEGNYKLNLAFIANIFNKYPALPEPEAQPKAETEEVFEKPELETSPKLDAEEVFEKNIVEEEWLEENIVEEPLVEMDAVEVESVVGHPFEHRLVIFLVIMCGVLFNYIVFLVKRFV